MASAIVVGLIFGERITLKKVMELKDRFECNISRVEKYGKNYIYIKSSLFSYIFESNPLEDILNNKNIEIKYIDKNFSLLLLKPEVPIKFDEKKEI